MNKSKTALLKAFDSGYRINQGILYLEGKPIIQKLGKSGYLYFNITILKRLTWWVKIHRLVAYQKFGEKIFEIGVVVRHKDGNRLNNLEENILIGSQSDNQLDIPKEVRQKNGRYASSHIQVHDHEAIKKRRAEGATYKELMIEFGISSTGTISYIINKSVNDRSRTGDLQGHNLAL